MYIIADSGSTKTHWCIVDRNGLLQDCYTSGINPIYQTEEELGSLLCREFVPDLSLVRRIHFYGAGCAFAEKNESVKKALSFFFKTDEIEIASDLLAAARSLSCHTPGIVCILGTGSNSCFFDGEHIVRHVRPLGFILGDEGSGGYLGKKLLGDILKEILPPEVREMFYTEYPYTYDELIDRVYRQPFPNRFLASFSHFIYKHLHIPEVEKIVCDAFREFIGRNLLQYENVRSHPISFTGSVAYYFRPQMEEILKEYGLTAGKFSLTPMEGLVRYHKQL